MRTLLKYTVQFGFTLHDGHHKLKKVMLIRHAESIFNAKCHKYNEENIYGKQAEKQFHHNLQILDCGVTDNGIKGLKTTSIYESVSGLNKLNTIFFVSPMLRTLQTSDIVLKEHHSKFDVKVLPELSQVLSKICDFSSGLRNKREKYEFYDFEWVDKWIHQKNLDKSVENWQDPFVDPHIRSQIDNEAIAGRRYLKLLKKRFPQPLENSQRCKQRSIKGFNKIYEISKDQQNAVIISHNRILKNIEQHLRGSKVQDFQNLQIRCLSIPSKAINKTDESQSQ